MPVEFHPIVFTFPALSKAKRSDLKKSIQENGCRMPVVRWEGKTIDGRHRQEICEELGIDCPFDIFEGTEEEAIALAESLNEDRRHQSAEEIQQRRERIAQARKDGKSLRQIAEDENISKAQVVRDIGVTGVPGGGTPEPETGKVTGRDGRQQSAKKKKFSKPKTEKTETPPASDPPPTTEPPQFKIPESEEQSREPGSDNQGLQGLEKPPKNGSVVLDWSDFNTHFGKLSRQIDNLYKACGLTNRHNAVVRDDDYRRVNDLLGSFYREFRELYTKKTGNQPPR